jgi:hypothetical protein
VLEGAVRLVLLVAGQVDLAEVGDDRAVPLDQDLGVVAVPDAVGIGFGQLGIPEAEPEAEPAGLVEQHLRLRPRHGGLVEMVELGDVVDEPPGEERRQAQLGVHDQVAPAVVALLEQGEQPLDHVLARIGPLDRAELSGADGDDA